MSKDRTTSLADVIAILYRAIEYGQPIDIILPDKKTAQSLRFRMYRAKAKERELMAVEQGIPETMVRHPFDTLHITIRPDETDAEHKRHIVSLVQLDLVLNELDIRDAKTGEKVEITHEPAVTHTGYHGDGVDTTDDDAADTGGMVLPEG